MGGSRLSSLVLALSTLAVAAGGGCSGSGNRLVYSEIRTAKVQAVAVETARELAIPGKIYVFGAVRANDGDDILTADDQPSVFELLRMVEHYLIQSGTPLLSEDRVAEVLDEIDLDPEDLFTSKGLAAIGQLLPAQIMVLGSVEEDRLVLQAVEMSSGIKLRSSIVGLKQLAFTIPDVTVFLSELDGLYIHDRDDAVLCFLRKYPKVVSQQQLGRMLERCHTDDRASVLQAAIKEELLRP